MEKTVVISHMNDLISFDHHALVADLVRRFGVRVRIKTLRSESVSCWCSWYIELDRQHFEAEALGPIRKDWLEWLEIDPIEVKWQGRLLKSKRIDHSVSLFDELRSVGIEPCVFDGMIRISGQKQRQAVSQGE